MKLAIKHTLLSSLLIFSSLNISNAVAQEHGLITWTAYAADADRPERILITFKMIEVNGKTITVGPLRSDVKTPVNQPVFSSLPLILKKPVNKIQTIAKTESGKEICRTTSKSLDSNKKEQYYVKIIWKHNSPAECIEVP